MAELAALSFSQQVSIFFFFSQADTLPTDAHIVYAMHVSDYTVEDGGRSHGRVGDTLFL